MVGRVGLYRKKSENIFEGRRLPKRLHPQLLDRMAAALLILLPIVQPPDIYSNPKLV